MRNTKSKRLKLSNVMKHLIDNGYNKKITEEDNEEKKVVLEEKRDAAEEYI